MWPGVVETNTEVSSQESAQWVLSRRGFDGGFRFSTGTHPVVASDDAICLSTGQAVLMGDPSLRFSLPDGKRGKAGNIEFIEQDDLLIGAGRIQVYAEILEDAAFKLYREILDLVADHSICRIWNYVPDINVVRPGLIENYKLFCIGRSKAFEAFFGGEFQQHFAAASATGTQSDYLTVVFIATRSEVENWENPEQIPAYRYPAQYGPRAPGFARASRFTGTDGVEWIFISGTASIKGHESMYVGDFARQVQVTLENIDIVLNNCEMRLQDCPSGRRRHFKAFLRNPADLSILVNQMEGVMSPQDSFTVVEGNICRSDLDVEIELTVFPSSDLTA